MSRTKRLQGAVLFDLDGEILMSCAIPNNGSHKINKMSCKMGKLLISELCKRDEYHGFINHISEPKPEWSGTCKLLTESQLLQLSYNMVNGTWNGFQVSISSEELINQLKYYSSIRYYKRNVGIADLIRKCSDGICTFNMIATLISQLEGEISEVPRFVYTSIYHELA